MNEEQYKIAFYEIINKNNKEVEEYIEKHGIPNTLDSQIGLIDKKYNKMLKKLQDEYYGKKE